MSFLDDYEFHSPTKFKQTKADSVSLNERLARAYDDIAVKLQDNEGSAGQARVMRYTIRCTPRVGGKTGAPLIGLDHAQMPLCKEFEKSSEAARFFEGLAQAVRNGDEKVMQLVATARAANKTRLAKYKMK